MLLSTNEVNNPKPRGRLSLLSKRRRGKLHKAFDIVLSPTHRPLNTGIAPYLKPDYSQTRRDAMMLMPRASNGDVTKRVDILVSIAMHYGKTFIPPLG